MAEGDSEWGILLEEYIGTTRGWGAGWPVVRACFEKARMKLCLRRSDVK